MNRILACALVAMFFVVASSAQAQATRTWVSGVGDDVNPCSRTAPCKTFAGAISKTAAGGEINCLDPGGFGAVTITKAMTINCIYTEGGALAGGNGIVVNAAANDIVVLRGLDIFGVNPPTNGIRFIAGGTLLIEDCTIRRFSAVNSFGVSFQPSGNSRLVISRSTISSNGNGATGGGILIQPTGAGGNARVLLDQVSLLQNANDSVRIDRTANTSNSPVLVDISNSRVMGSTNGVSVITPAGASAATVNLTSSTLTGNTFGAALSVNGSAALIRASGNIISNNSVAVSINGGGSIRSYGDNVTDGNENVSSFTAPNLTRS